MSISVFIIVLLGASAIWFWLVGKARMTSLSLKWSSNSQQVDAIHKPNLLVEWIVSVLWEFLSPFLSCALSPSTGFGPIGPIQYHGRATLPSRVYEGDSKVISVSLEPLLWHYVAQNELRKLENDSDTQFVLDVQTNDNSEQSVEIELLAAGFKVDGEMKQRHALYSETLYYNWNCYFEKSGDYELGLVLRLVNRAGTFDLGPPIQHKMKVAKLDHLTQRQVWLLASLTGIVSGVLGVAKILHELNVW